MFTISILLTITTMILMSLKLANPSMSMNLLKDSGHMNVQLERETHILRLFGSSLSKKDKFNFPILIYVKMQRTTVTMYSNSRILVESLMVSIIST